MRGCILGGLWLGLGIGEGIGETLRRDAQVNGMGGGLCVVGILANFQGMTQTAHAGHQLIDRLDCGPLFGGKGHFRTKPFIFHAQHIHQGFFAKLKLLLVGGGGVPADGNMPGQLSHPLPRGLQTLPGHHDPFSHAALCLIQHMLTLLQAFGQFLGACHVRAPSEEVILHGQESGGCFAVSGGSRRVGRIDIGQSQANAWQKSGLLTGQFCGAS